MSAPVSDNAVAKLRVRAVRFKGGGEVRMLPCVRNEERGAVEAAVHGTLDAMYADRGDVAGYAFVAWDSKGLSAIVYSPGGPIPAALIPEFVKSRIPATVAERWAVEEIQQ